MRRRFRKGLVAGAIGLALTTIMIPAAGMALAEEKGPLPVKKAAGRIRVFPLLFLAREASLPAEQVAAAWARLGKALAHTQAHFKTLLRTDTFAIEPNPAPVYRSPNPHRSFMTPRGSSPDSAHLMLRELWSHYGEDRESTRRIYLLIYTRNGKQACGKGQPPRPCLGGGRSIDAYPDPGGGIVQLEFQSLMENWPYPFQSTLTHEIGHAFGLTHVDCLGYDMQRNGSIMSYNPAHLAKEPVPGVFPGNLNPEEYALLSLHRRAFPDFRYDPARHNPNGKLPPHLLQCVTGPMDGSLGFPKNKGYRLYYDGKLVSGPEAAIYAFHTAEQNCRWNMENRPTLTVTCTYSGKSLAEWRAMLPANRQRGKLE